MKKQLALALTLSFALTHLTHANDSVDASKIDACFTTIQDKIMMRCFPGENKQVVIAAFDNPNTNFDEELTDEQGECLLSAAKWCIAQDNTAPAQPAHGNRSAKTNLKSTFKELGTHIKNKLEQTVNTELNEFKDEAKQAIDDFDF